MYVKTLNINPIFSDSYKHNNNNNNFFKCKFTLSVKLTLASVMINYNLLLLLQGIV